MSLGQANPNVAITTTNKVAVMFPGDYAAADEGSFYTATLAATAATAVACTTQALADTNANLALFNGNPVGGFNIYLRYIKVVTTAVPGSNASINYSMLVDNLTTKLTTVGTALNTPQNVNTASLSKSNMVGYGGLSITAAQSANGRRIGAGQVIGGLGVALDETIYHFGQPVFGGDVNGTVTNIKRLSISCAPCILAPGWWFTLGTWGASQAASAASYSWEIGYIERPWGQ